MDTSKSKDQMVQAKDEAEVMKEEEGLIDE